MNFVCVSAVASTWKVFAWLTSPSFWVFAQRGLFDNFNLKYFPVSHCLFFNPLSHFIFLYPSPLLYVYIHFFVYWLYPPLGCRTMRSETLSFSFLHLQCLWNNTWKRICLQWKFNQGINKEMDIKFGLSFMRLRILWKLPNLSELYFLNI